MLTDLERSAAFLLTLDYRSEDIVKTLCRIHRRETEGAVRDAVTRADEHCSRFKRELAQALDEEAVREEHRG